MGTWIVQPDPPSSHLQQFLPVIGQTPTQSRGCFVEFPGEGLPFGPTPRSLELFACVPLMSFRFGPRSLGTAWASQEGLASLSGLSRDRILRLKSASALGGGEGGGEGIRGDWGVGWDWGKRGSSNQLQGNLLFIWGVRLWKAHFVASQKWIHILTSFPSQCSHFLHIFGVIDHGISTSTCKPPR